MKKLELARRLARKSGVTPAEAADELDRVIHHILCELRKGQSVPLPGLGKFSPGGGLRIVFEPELPEGKPRHGE